MHLHLLRKKFADTFGADAEQTQVFFSPGRLCLIGEHIDYNGGLVMPAAISLGIYGVFRSDDSNTLRMRSGLEKNEVTLYLDDDIVFSEKAGWGNYPAGVVKYLRQHGIKVPGGNLLFESNLPVGAGLSSSAALEILTAFVFASFHDTFPARIELAKLCKAAENDFVGVQCGIMDQFAVAMGKKNHALVLNCNTLEYEHIPAELGDYAIVIFNTNKKRELTGSLFNVRVRECGEAQMAIHKHRRIENLAEAAEADVNDWVHDPAAKKRALHIVRENNRVREAASALRAGDIQKFGMLLFQSHASLRQYYEVTGRELDTLEEAARSHPACIGAKMSGAGFGGCIFAIVKKNATDDFVSRVLERYHAKTRLHATPYFTEIEDGVRRVG